MELPLHILGEHRFVVVPEFLHLCLVVSILFQFSLRRPHAVDRNPHEEHVDTEENDGQDKATNSLTTGVSKRSIGHNATALGQEPWCTALDMFWVRLIGRSLSVHTVCVHDHKRDVGDDGKKRDVDMEHVEGGFGKEEEERDDGNDDVEAGDEGAPA